MSPSWMQNKFVKKFDFKKTELCMASPGHSRGGNKQMQLIPVIIDETTAVDKKLKTFGGKEQAQYYRNKSKLFDDSEIVKKLVNCGRYD